MKIETKKKLKIKMKTQKRKVKREMKTNIKIKTKMKTNMSMKMRIKMLGIKTKMKINMSRKMNIKAKIRNWRRIFKGKWIRYFSIMEYFRLPIENWSNKSKLSFLGIYLLLDYLQYHLFRNSIIYMILQVFSYHEITVFSFK